MRVPGKSLSWAKDLPHTRYHRVLGLSDTQAFDYPPDVLRIEAASNATLNIMDRSGEEISYDLERGTLSISGFYFWKLMATGSSSINSIIGQWINRPPDPLTVPAEQSRFYEEATSE